MTQDEIIEMAKQAGSIDSEDVILTVYNAFTSVEREACANLVEVEAMQYAEPVWALEIVNDIRARGQA